MGQNKVENQIKEKLNSREIQPSPQAWDRLDAMLSVAEEKKTGRPFGFLFIAASIMVLLTAGIFFFTQNTLEVNNKSIVVEKGVIKDTTVKAPNTNTPIPLNEKKEESQVAETNPTIINKSHNNSNTAVSIINQKSNQKQSNNPLINRDKKIEFQNSSDVALKNLPRIETRKEIVLPSNSVLSDEQLLASLDKTAKKSSEKNNVVKVNPKSLLSQVDGELDQTFREKVIGKIAKNYQEVKVALANRNNE
ncbi:hypothetical protein [Flavobacterium sp.]|uniref:hypothetical protein n=1 Tax=Flavobacterium sp. TaxID=239 RepID=UPI0024882F10|nr:hypothetical protein [Flavobacterium sp.]MDI1316439.1 hypothetical protein [Flavobacterium sp.]